MLLLPLLVALVHAADEQAVQLAVAVEGAAPGTAVWASTTWLGEARRLELRDDGSAPQDRAGDGVYVGRWSGAPLRVLPLRLAVQAPGRAPATVLVADEVLPAGEAELAYAVALGPTPRVRRVALAGSARSAETADVLRTVGAIGWGAVALGWVAWLVGRAARR